MNSPRPTYLEYQIVRVRLVNFHNFVNETIDIRKGGHLFLVGPNGSGKSTVIDAIHTVLSAAHDLELNAAARLGGRKDEGRTLQGVVLRYDRELGALNEGGGISYAAIELATANGDKRLSLGVGLEATTMEARLSRWGFFARNCGVAELPLLIEELQGQRPATRDELGEKIGKANVYGRVNQFRKKLAEEFFASEFLYEQVAHLWNTGKAYREICARAGDFQTLFMNLLPAPDTEIFSEIIRSLGIIQEFANKLAQLAEQLRYLDRLLALQEKIATAREEEARYDWLISHRAAAICKNQISETQQRAGEIQAQTQTVESELTQLLQARDLLKKTLADLRHQDQAHLLTRLQDKKAELNRQTQTLKRLQAQLQSYAEQLRRAQKELTAAHAELIAEIELLQHELSSALAKLKIATSALKIFADDFLTATPVMLAQRGARPETTAALQEMTTLINELSQQRLRWQHEIEQHELRKAKLLAEIEALQHQREWLPQLPNYHQCLQRLESAGMAPQPLYKMLEWRTNEANVRSAIEELLGQQLLGALVVNGNADERLKKIVLEEFSGIAVVAPELIESSCPDWIAEALEDRSDGAAFSIIAAALTARETQQAEYEKRLQQLALRGLYWRAENKPAQFIGAQARRAAFAQELAQRQAELETQEKAITLLQTQLRDNLILTQQGRELEACLRRENLPQAFRAHETATERAQFAKNAHDEWARNCVLVEEERQALDDAIQQLEQHIAAAGLRELAERIAEMEKQEKASEEKLQRVTENRGRLRNERERLQNDIAQRQEQLAQLEQVLQTKASRLRQFVSPEAAPDLEYYVLSTRGGERFKTEENILERRQKAHDEIGSALAHLQGTGEDGIHFRQYAGIFGFGYLAEENKIIDRQHQPLSGMRQRLQQDYAEQQEILNEKNKELLDRLIMESLSRHLTEQVVQQKALIKGINRLLHEIDFSGTVYEFAVHAKPEHREIVAVVENFSLLDESRRQNFRAFIEARLAELRESEPDTVPPLLDYRTWFDYKLTFRDTKSEATELTRRMRNLGSGGEQAVPNYLLVLAMAHLVFQNSRSRLRPMLFDEAFYGIDAAKRERLLEFSTKLGLQLFVASPDQDGHTRAVRNATTVFVLKDENRDVHLTPLHSHFAPVEQEDIFFEATTEGILATA